MWISSVEDVVALSSASRLFALRAFQTYPFAFIVSRLRSWRLHRVSLRTAATIIALALVVIELRSSWLQSWVFTAVSHRATFMLLPGPGDAIRYTRSGPYDERLGYLRIPKFLERTESRGYQIQAQARPSKLYLTMADLGVFPILLVLTVLSGLEVHMFRYAGFALTCHFIYALHIIIATPMLLVEMSFGRWSHMVYRPLDLYFLAVRERTARQAPAAEVVPHAV